MVDEPGRVSAAATGTGRPRRRSGGAPSMRTRRWSTSALSSQCAARSASGQVVARAEGRALRRRARPAGWLPATRAGGRQGRRGRQVPARRPRQPHGGGRPTANRRASEGPARRTLHDVAAPDRLERLTDLVLVLLGATRPLTLEEIATEIPATRRRTTRGARRSSATSACCETRGSTLRPSPSRALASSGTASSRTPSTCRTSRSARGTDRFATRRGRRPPR